MSLHQEKKADQDQLAVINQLQRSQQLHVRFSVALQQPRYLGGDNIHRTRDLATGLGENLLGKTGNGQGGLFNFRLRGLQLCPGLGDRIIHWPSGSATP